LRIASVALHVPCVGCEIDTSTRARASADTRHRTATERRILDRCEKRRDPREERDAAAETRRVGTRAGVLRGEG
jgi:hypothetical protein